MRDVAFPSSIIEDFQNSFPESGDPEPQRNALIVISKVRENFSPIYDNHTWKLEKDDAGNQTSKYCVAEKWWPLLENMLVRPNVRSKFVPVLVKVYASSG